MESATLNFSILVCIQKEKKHGDKQSIFGGEGFYILASVQTKLCIFFFFPKIRKNNKNNNNKKKKIKSLTPQLFFFLAQKQPHRKVVGVGGETMMSSLGTRGHALVPPASLRCTFEVGG